MKSDSLKSVRMRPYIRSRRIEWLRMGYDAGSDELDTAFFKSHPDRMFFCRRLSRKENSGLVRDGKRKPIGAVMLLVVKTEKGFDRLLAPNPSVSYLPPPTGDCITPPTGGHMPPPTGDCIPSAESEENISLSIEAHQLLVLFGGLTGSVKSALAAVENGSKAVAFLSWRKVYGGGQIPGRLGGAA